MWTNPLTSVEDYETFIYTLADEFPCIRVSTLVLARIGPLTSVVRGELHFYDGYVLRVLEVIDWRRKQIESYGYELWKEGEQLWWYDSWPHPGIPELAENHPHHKHIPPDIKHHRVPAPGMSFDSPNLPILIQEIAPRHLSPVHKQQGD
jgi:hypothetical protein